MGGTVGCPDGVVEGGLEGEDTEGLSVGVAVKVQTLFSTLQVSTVPSFPSSQSISSSQFIAGKYPATVASLSLICRALSLAASPSAIPANSKSGVENL